MEAISCNAPRAGFQCCTPQALASCMVSYNAGHCGCRPVPRLLGNATTALLASGNLLQSLATSLPTSGNRWHCIVKLCQPLLPAAMQGLRPGPTLHPFTMLLTQTPYLWNDHMTFGMPASSISLRTCMFQRSCGGHSRRCTALQSYRVTIEAATCCMQKLFQLPASSAGAGAAAWHTRHHPCYSCGGG